MSEEWEFGEPPADVVAAYKAWCETRPPVVRAIAERLPPWYLYRMKSTGQIVTMAAVAEDGTVRVDVTGQFNEVLFDRSVFGIDPHDLERVDLSAVHEHVGAMLTPEQVEANKDFLRCMVRPDLWTMGGDGTAKRKDN